MTTFTQALARIETLIKPSTTREPDFYQECQGLLMEHADSIVQLGKVSQEMADKSEVLTQLLQDESFAKGAEKRKIGAAIDRAQIEMVEAWGKHYKLMKGDDE